MAKTRSLTSNKVASAGSEPKGSDPLKILQNLAAKVKNNVGQVNAELQSEQIVTINAGGKLFQTYVKTLRKFPGVCLTWCDMYWDLQSRPTVDYDASLHL